MPSQVQCLLLVLRKDQSVQSGANEFVGNALQVCFYVCQIEAKYQPVTYLDLFAHRLTWSSIFILANGPATLVPPNIFCKKVLPIFKGCYVTFMEGTPPQGTKIFPPIPAGTSEFHGFSGGNLFWRTMTPCICFRSGCDLASGDEWDAGARSRKSCYINQLILLMEEILRQLIW